MRHGTSGACRPFLCTMAHEVALELDAGCQSETVDREELLARSHDMCALCELLASSSALAAEGPRGSMTACMLEVPFQECHRGFQSRVPSWESSSASIYRPSAEGVNSRGECLDCPGKIRVTETVV